MGPLTLAFLVAMVLGFFVFASSPPKQNASAASVIAYYQAHGSAALTGIYIIGIGLVLLTFFVSALRIALTEAGSGHNWLPTAAFAGGILFIGGFAANGITHFALPSRLQQPGRHGEDAEFHRQQRPGPGVQRPLRAGARHGRGDPDRIGPTYLPGSAGSRS
ncbi:hypothetical protein [Streptomyces sp. NPDC051554]|uniref:hypothetical protein n=1 Tax=Streptomyces sp. NPDC051554 TaxID=3365656 RepID=UPI0037BBE4AF